MAGRAMAVQAPNQLIAPAVRQDAERSAQIGCRAPRPVLRLTRSEDVATAGGPLG
jgi:hypothetical protein